MSWKDGTVLKLEYRVPCVPALLRRFWRNTISPGAESHVLIVSEVCATSSQHLQPNPITKDEH